MKKLPSADVLHFFREAAAQGGRARSKTSRTKNYRSGAVMEGRPPKLKEGTGRRPGGDGGDRKDART
jgi:hypothetical protein